MRRVVVTGLGIVSSIGNNAQEVLASLREGRSVIAVRAGGRAKLDAARGILLERSAHFLNWFGRFSTEEVAPWRGPEPDVPDFLRR